MRTTRDTTSSDAGFSLADIGLGKGVDYVGNIAGTATPQTGDSPQVTPAGQVTPAASSTSTSGMNRSEGSGSGHIDPQTMGGNDAQWLRVLSLVVYGNTKTSGASAGSTPGGVPALDPNHPPRRVIPFPRRPRPGLRDDPAVSSTGYAAQNPDSASGSGQSDLPGIELSALRCVFSIAKATISTPDIMHARIYNLSPQTLGKVIEFTRVRVMAGYKYSNFGLIFDGEVVVYRKGKENPTDTYLEILAADGDQMYASVIVDSVKAGQKESDEMQKIEQARKQVQPNYTTAYQAQNLYTRTIIRDRMIYGTSRSAERRFSRDYESDNFVDLGGHVMMEKSGYRPGTMVVLSPKTGLVGLPEVTPQGIQARCLLNPMLRLGGIVKIDTDALSGVAFLPGTLASRDANGNITGPGAPTGGMILNNNLLNNQSVDIAYTSPVGRYKICLMNYSGDTRGNQWYCDLVCVALNAQNEVMRGSNGNSNAFKRAFSAVQNTPEAELPK